MEFRYIVTFEDSTAKIKLSKDGVLTWIKNWSSSKIEAIRISRESDDHEEYLDTKILWTIDKSEYLFGNKKTISADSDLNWRDKVLCMNDLIYRLFYSGYISKEMYDKYWEYRHHWPTNKYLVTIRAEENAEPEDDKLICCVDQITGQKFYTSEQVAKSIAKQIEDDMNIPWGDTEGYSKYFKGEGNMKININTGGIDTSDNYSKLVRTYYLGQVNNPYNICATKMETTIKPASGRYKCEKGLDSVIRKVQINEKKKVCTIVWTDGQVTLAKCGENDIWDPEKGLLVCIAKRFWVSGTQFNKWLKAQIPEAGPVEKAAEFFDEKLADTYVPKHATK